MFYIYDSSSAGGDFVPHFCLHANDTASPLLIPTMDNPTIFPSGPNIEITMPANDAAANEP